MVPVVERHEQSAFRARIQKTLSLWVCAHNSNEVVSGEVTVNFAPALSVLSYLINVWFKVIHFVAGNGNVHSTPFVRTDLNRVNLSTL